MVDLALAATMAHDAVLDGRYVIEGELGSGGMGIVLRARHRFTDIAVAIKMLRPQFAVDPDVQRRFLAEARAPNAIGHRGIVQVLDAGKTARGELYLVMELLHGRPLRTVAPGGVQRTALELLDALGAAHACGIVHRDLKPENVFLCDPDGSVKLLDFGIAKIQSSDASARTAEGTLLGTLAYMAPEQLVDARGVDARADLWAVGVMLYELVAGRLPYNARTAAEMFVELQYGAPTPIAAYLPHAPVEVSAFFERALARDPAQRFHTAADMAEVLKRLPIDAASASGGFAPTVPRASAREPAPPPPPAIWGGRGLVIGLGLVSIALIAAAIVLAVRGSAGDTSAAIDETATRLVENSAVTDRGELVSPPPSSAHTVPAAPVQPAPPPPAPPPAVPALPARPPTPPPPARPAAKRVEKQPSPAAASHVVVPAPPASPESSPPEPAIVGSAPRPSNNVWVGRYSCAQGATALRLAISATNTTVTATFTFGPLPENPGVRRGSFRMVGQARATGASVEYDLRPTAWIDRPDGYVMVGVSATKNGASLHGTIRAAGCGALDATLAGSD